MDVCNGEQLAGAWRVCAYNEGEECTCNGTVFFGRKYAATGMEEPEKESASSVSTQLDGFFEQDPVQGARVGATTATADQLRELAHTTKQVSGSVNCTAVGMGGDPSPGYEQFCICIAAATATPTTAPSHSSSNSGSESGNNPRSKSGSRYDVVTSESVPGLDNQGNDVVVNFTKSLQDMAAAANCRSGRYVAVGRVGTKGAKSAPPKDAKAVFSHNTREKIYCAESETDSGMAQGDRQDIKASMYDVLTPAGAQASQSGRLPYLPPHIEIGAGTVDGWAVFNISCGLHQQYVMVKGDAGKEDKGRGNPVGMSSHWHSPLGCCPPPESDQYFGLEVDSLKDWKHGCHKQKFARTNELSAKDRLKMRSWADQCFALWSSHPEEVGRYGQRPAACSSRFMVKILRCKTCDCSGATVDLQTRHELISEDQRCNPWFGVVDAMIRQATSVVKADTIKAASKKAAGCALSIRVRAPTDSPTAAPTDPAASQKSSALDSPTSSPTVPPSASPTVMPTAPLSTKAPSHAPATLTTTSSSTDGTVTTTTTVTIAP